MNKRGQIYILVSLILGLIIFVLSSKPNIINISSAKDDFKDISVNYNQESSRFLNSLIKEKIVDSVLIKDKFTSFSLVFAQYSKSQNPSFGLIYLLNYNNRLYLGNFLDKQIIINDENWPANQVIPGCFEQINTTIKYGVGGIIDTFDLFQFTGCSKDFPNPLNNNFLLKIGDELIDYEITVFNDQPEVVVISREGVLEDRKVFVENQFIQGKKRKNG